MGDWLGRVPRKRLLLLPVPVPVPATPWSMHPCWNCGLAAYLGCESAWEPGKRSEWRTSHLTGYGMESSGHSRALERAGSGPQREQRHRENRHYCGGS